MARVTPKHLQNQRSGIDRIYLDDGSGKRSISWSRFDSASCLPAATCLAVSGVSSNHRTTSELKCFSLQHRCAFSSVVKSEHGDEQILLQTSASPSVFLGTNGSQETAVCAEYMTKPWMSFRTLLKDFLILCRQLSDKYFASSTVTRIHNVHTSPDTTT